MTQQLPVEWRRGTVVRVRGERWRILELTAFPECALLDLSGIGRTNAGDRRSLLTPFDRPVTVHPPAQPRVVRRGTWMSACRTLICQAASAGHLRTAASARVDVLPYQLEPALALLRGESSRFLLADEVGLGKTIQAALMLAELRARGQGDRVLVLTPAGLRDQWADELLARFGIRAEIVDRHNLKSRAASLPRGVNPWTRGGVWIASCDFVKQPDVLRPMLGVVWDALLIDEAHDASTAPERAAAVRALAERAWRVVLMTATPHSGDTTGFESLCNIGKLRTDGPLAVFRRSRADVGLHVARRVRVLPVAPTASEHRMHAILEQYAASVWRHATARADRGAQLAMIVLCKRGFSSASSLLRSVDRRIALLEQGPAAWAQSLLPFTASAADTGEHESADADDAALAAPGLDDRERERDWLLAVRDTALDAAREESKTRTLLRMLSRTREAALVFTEFRDTLTHLSNALQSLGGVASLHGGMSRAERQDASRMFTSGATRILLATDIAGQGLNLHATCRLVINLELPWSPVRLEQRIGRVDRIGQRRRVHACHLVAKGTNEQRVLVGLVKRLARVRASLGELRSPLGVTETQIAHLMIDRPSGADNFGFSKRRHERQPPTPAAPAIVPFIAPRMHAIAPEEAARVAHLRRLLFGGRRQTFAPLQSSSPLVTLSRRRSEASRRGQLCALYRILMHDAAGRVVDERLTAISGLGSPLNPAATPRLIRQWMASHWRGSDEQFRTVLRDVAEKALEDARADSVRRVTRLHARGEGVLEGLVRATRASPTQVGLFDRRAIRHVEQTIGELNDERIEVLRRMHALAETLSTPLGLDISIALLLLPGV